MRDFSFEGFLSLDQWVMQLLELDHDSFLGLGFYEAVDTHVFILMTSTFWSEMSF